MLLQLSVWIILIFIFLKGQDLRHPQKMIHKINKKTSTRPRRSGRWCMRSCRNVKLGSVAATTRFFRISLQVRNALDYMKYFLNRYANYDLSRAI